MPDDTPGREFQRGREAGEIAARLAQHDRHFATINGSIEQLAGKMGEMTEAIQRLASNQESRDLVAASVAAALVKERERRYRKLDQRWAWPMRWAAVFTMLAAVATVAGVLIAVYRK